MADYVNPVGWLVAAAQGLLYVIAAPLFAAWVKRIKARLQNRRGAALMQPWLDLRKLMQKETIVAHTASPVFRAAPYIVFGGTLLAAMVVPLLVVKLPTTAIADVIVLVGFLALARFFLALAGMDVGTAFGGMGASREMLISAMAEPALLMVVFTVAMTAHSTNLSSVIELNLQTGLVLRPSFMFAILGLILVAIAETGRIPIDNPATHLELTMVHEAMILEYSGRHLALMEWAAQLKLMLYAVLLVNVFFPWGMAQSLSPMALLISFVALCVKLGILGGLLAIVETVFTKMRLFRVPLYLNLAFLFATLGLLSHVILETGP